MLRFMGMRLAQLAVVVLAVTLLFYWMLNLLPGNPCVAAFGGAATEEQIAECERDRNLDDPVIVQWAKWGGDVLTGDFGKSYLTGRTFGEAISNSLPRTLLLMGYSQLLALGAAIPLGAVVGIQTGQCERQDRERRRVRTAVRPGIRARADTDSGVRSEAGLVRLERL